MDTVTIVESLKIRKSSLFRYFKQQFYDYCISDILIFWRVYFVRYHVFFLSEMRILGVVKRMGGGLNISQNSAKRDFDEFFNYLKRAIKSSKNEQLPKGK